MNTIKTKNKYVPVCEGKRRNIQLDIIDKTDSALRMLVFNRTNRVRRMCRVAKTSAQLNALCLFYDNEAQVQETAQRFSLVNW